jgi:KTSC domain
MARKKAGAPPKATAPRQYNRDKNGRFAKATKERATRRAEPAEDIEGEDLDSEGEVLRTDLGPWAETPNSSRVSAYRYDYMKQETQVTWRNNGNPGYAYSGMSYEDFRRFARIASKGKYINSTLNGLSYRRLTPDEVSAPSNRERRAVSRSRA